MSKNDLRIEQEGPIQNVGQISFYGVRLVRFIAKQTWPEKLIRARWRHLIIEMLRWKDVRVRAD